MKISFSTLACPNWGWSELLAKASRYGYGGIEVRQIGRQTDLLALPEFQRGELPRRRRELDEAGLVISGLASSVRFDYPDAAERAKQVEVGRAYLDLAAELGADFIRVFGDTIPQEANPSQHETAVRQIAEGLQSLGAYAEEVGPAVLLETHGDFSDTFLVRETLQQVSSPAVGVLWDAHHPWRFCGEPVAESFERLRRWLGHTQWKDSVSQPRREASDVDPEAAKDARALMSGHRHANYVLFGEGEFPAAECMQRLVDAGFDGWFCLEWEKTWHPEIEDADTALPPFPRQIRALRDACRRA